MHRLVRIEGLHDFQVGNPLKFVLYDGSNYITLDGFIHRHNYIEFKNHTIDCIKLFQGFGINSELKAWKYCKQYDDKCTNGLFPQHSSLVALKKTLRSFFNLNQHIKISSLYKVGDKVKIKSKYDQNSKCEDYPCGFTREMLNKYGEITDTIKEVVSSNYFSKKHYVEPYVYQLKSNAYTWSASMFDGKIKNKPKQGILGQIEYSQTKTQGNAYQFCKARGTVRVGNVPEGNRICGKRSKTSISSRPLGYRKVTGY